MYSGFDDVIHEWFGKITADPLPPLREAVKGFRADLIARALLISDGHKGKAAGLLNIKVGTFREMVSEGGKMQRLNATKVKGVLSRKDLSRETQAALLGVSVRAVRYWICRLGLGRAHR